MQRSNFTQEFVELTWILAPLGIGLVLAVGGLVLVLGEVGSPTVHAASERAQPVATSLGEPISAAEEGEEAEENLADAGDH